MFPSACETDAMKYISQAQGDPDKAARLMLLDQAETTLSAYNASYHCYLEVLL